MRKYLWFCSQNKYEHFFVATWYPHFTCPWSTLIATWPTTWGLISYTLAISNLEGSMNRYPLVQWVGVWMLKNHNIKYQKCHLWSFTLFEPFHTLKKWFTRKRGGKVPNIYHFLTYNDERVIVFPFCLPSPESRPFSLPLPMPMWCHYICMAIEVYDKYLPILYQLKVDHF